MELKRLRKERKLTQQNIADFLKLPLRTYQNYEREVREPDTDLLCKLADLYGVTLDELFGRQAHETQRDLSPDELNLVALYRQMDAEDKKTFIRNAQLFAFAGDVKKKEDDRVSPGTGNLVNK